MYVYGYGCAFDINHCSTVSCRPLARHAESGSVLAEQLASGRTNRGQRPLNGTEPTKATRILTLAHWSGSLGLFDVSLQEEGSRCIVEWIIFLFFYLTLLLLHLLQNNPATHICPGWETTSTVLKFAQDEQPITENMAACGFCRRFEFLSSFRRTGTRVFVYQCSVTSCSAYCQSPDTHRETQTSPEGNIPFNASPTSL